MTAYDYVIIGAGTAADGAARGIRQLDHTGSIGILGLESYEPYSRTALTHGLWDDVERAWAGLHLGTATHSGARIHLDARATSIDTELHKIAVDGHRPVGYGRLLLATGAIPNRLPGNDEGVMYFRGLDDYKLLRMSAHRGSTIVVIGGGLLGSELAAVLIEAGVQVHLVFPQKILGGALFPDAIARRYHELFVRARVRLHAGRRAVSSYLDDDGDVTVLLDDGSRIVGDVAVAAIGEHPAAALAKKAGLARTDGVAVDAHLATSDPRIWAAGDVACYPDRALGRTRVAHEDSALHQGWAAGAAMAGGQRPYRYTPRVRTEVLGVHWEAIGRTDHDLETRVTEHPDGTLVTRYYDRLRRPTGTLLWRAPENAGMARTELQVTVQHSRTPTERHPRENSNREWRRLQLEGD